MTLFELKKLIGALLMPLPLFLLLVSLSAVLLWRNRTGLATTLLTATCVCGYLLTTPFFLDPLIAKRDTQFRPLHGGAAISHADYIVVLGCQVRPVTGRPANGQLGPCTQVRLVEGLRQLVKNPKAKLITSGAGYGGVTNAALMAEVAKELGFAQSRIIQSKEARDTEREAEHLAKTLVDKTVILVTSAAHMPRAVRYFNQQGIEVIPAPTDWHALHTQPWHRQFIPSLEGLDALTKHWHEIIGSTWQAIKS